MRIPTQKPARPILSVLAVLLLAALACNLPFSPPAAPDPTAPAGDVPQQTEVMIYLLALNDNGASGTLVGCGDSLVEVRREVAPTTQPARTALETLLSMKEQTYGESGLYNALYQSNLRIERMEVNAEDILEVALVGELRLGGSCDAPRVKAQIVQTVLTGGGYQWAEVFINGTPIDEVLSQQ